MAEEVGVRQPGCTLGEGSVKKRARGIFGINQGCGLPCTLAPRRRSPDTRTGGRRVTPPVQRAPSATRSSQ
eukprot:scaffold89569_cov63-Phaeocystis_antarctica.AAC.3